MKNTRFLAKLRKTRNDKLSNRMTFFETCHADAGSISRIRKKLLPQIRRLRFAVYKAEFNSSTNDERNATQR